MADMEPPENVLFICQLNPQTNVSVGSSVVPEK